MRTFSVLFIAALLLTGCNNTKQPSTNQKELNSKVIIGYIYGGGGVDWEAYNANKFTHINYAFANIIDGKMAFEIPNDYANIKRLIDSKKDNPNLKVMVSVGGWTWSGNFSDMALTQETRAVFISSAIEELRKTNIDGIDLDWEYPGQKGLNNTHRPEDKENFTLLLTEFRLALNQEAKLQKRNEAFLLTIAVGADQTFLDHTNMKQAQEHLDFVNLMTYDFYTTADSTSGHHANLYNTSDNYKNSSVDASVKLFLNAGVPKSKLVMGIPFYNRIWTQVQAINDGQYAFSPKKEKLEASMVNEKISNNEFPLIYNKEAKAKYRYSKKLAWFMSVEDTAIVRLKSKYILEQDLAGAMFWAFRADKTDLLDVLNEELISVRL